MIDHLDIPFLAEAVKHLSWPDNTITWKDADVVLGEGGYVLYECTSAKEAESLARLLRFAPDLIEYACSLAAQNAWLISQAAARHFCPEPEDHKNCPNYRSGLCVYEGYNPDKAQQKRCWAMAAYEKQAEMFSKMPEALVNILQKGVLGDKQNVAHSCLDGLPTSTSFARLKEERLQLAQWISEMYANNAVGYPYIMGDTEKFKTTEGVLAQLSMQFVDDGGVLDDVEEQSSTG